MRSELTTVALAWCLVVPSLVACDETRDCAAYACGNRASLAGSLSFGVPTRTLGVEWCREDECVEGTIALDAPSQTACTVPAGPSGNGVCIGPWQGNEDGDAGATESRSVLATWQLGAPTRVPADGTRFHLRLADHDSGAELLDVERTADYEITSLDSCHRCFGADMTF